MFQSNAFQSFAFQSVGVGSTSSRLIGGHFIPGHGKHKRTLSNVLTVYNKAQALPRKETKELRDIISEFVEPAVALQSAVPDIAKVDYKALQQNVDAYERFIQALLDIQERLEIMKEAQASFLAKSRAEDDELLLVAIFACVIH